MPDNLNTSTPQRTHKRRPGQRMSKQERDIAQKQFLKSFSMTANVRAACMAAGIDRTLVYQWKEHDETFSFQFKQAELDANDMIRAELFRRAVQGVKKPVVSMGKVVYQDGEPLMVLEYSDTLLSLLAKARMPEFRDKQSIEHSGSLNVTRDYSKYTDEELAVLEQLARKGQE